jgi:ribonuclease Z
LHGDHYFGLIGLISSMHLLGRKKDLHIHAHKELKEIIDLQLRSSDTELNFPLFFHPIPEDLEGVIFEDDNIKVSNLLLDHSIKCSGFVFEEIRSKRKIIKSEVEKLNVPYDKMKSLKNGVDWINKKGEIIPNEQLTIENSKPHTYAFCSDTRYNEQLISKIEGVDLLYHETTFKKDLEERAFQTGHSTTLQAASIARRSNVKSLLIGHYSQRYRDFQELADESKEIFENVIVSYSGLEIDFKKLQ